MSLTGRAWACIGQQIWIGITGDTDAPGTAGGSPWLLIGTIRRTGREDTPVTSRSGTRVTFLSVIDSQGTLSRRLVTSGAMAGVSGK
jgi:hypothetical protein